MNTVSPWRSGLIAAVTLLSLVIIFPSVRFFLALGEDRPTDPEQVEAYEARLDDLRDGAITLGLDLRGGVDVTLMIDKEESISNAAGAIATSINNQFLNQNISADATQIEDTPQIRVRLQDPAEARTVSNILQNYSDQLTGDMGQSGLERTKIAILGINEARIRQAIENDIRGAEKVIRERLDKFGTTQPTIALQGKDKIRVQVPGERDPEALVENLTKLALLEFKLAHELYTQPTYPLIGMLDENGELREDATPILGHEIVDYRFGEFDATTGEITYETGIMLVEKETLMTGLNLRSAGVIQDPTSLTNPIKVSFQFDREGTKTFAEVTLESKKRVDRGEPPRHLAVILDGVVRSAPRMEVIIAGGSGVIEGGFSFQEAQDLSLLLKAGALNAPLIVESKLAVGASLGTESIMSGLSALAWGSLLVVVFMIAYYGTAGVVSVFALALNVLIILMCLKLGNATLTLSGIGGILLTVGMAVDANVLIYERIREEFDSGRPLRQAISIGFDRAFTVILDSNLTTLMTALVLLQFTEGSVRGFAVTMAIGLVANLFTGLMVTSTLCLLWFQYRDRLSLGRLRPFKNSTINFIRMRFASWGFSALLILGGIGAVAANGGLQFGVDFTGGLITEVRFAEPTNEGAIREMLRGSGLEGARVQAVSGTDDYIIRVKMLEIAEAGKEAEPNLLATEATLVQGLSTTYGENGFELMNSTSYGAETGQGFRSMAISVIFLASFVILLYLWGRFEFVFGAAAVVALVHDLAITLLWSSFWGVEITLDVVAALMVMLGFSVNDSIVVFDRIRENVRKIGGKNFGDICNLSMNQSLSRTLITSGTAVLVIIVMLFLGGEGLRPFAKVLLIGSIVGTYSSNFLAAPIVYQWNEFRKGGTAETLKAKDKPIGPEAAKVPTPSRSGRANLPRRRTV